MNRDIARRWWPAATLKLELFRCRRHCPPHRLCPTAQLLLFWLKGDAPTRKVRFEFLKKFTLPADSSKIGADYANCVDDAQHAIMKATCASLRQCPNARIRLGAPPALAGIQICVKTIDRVTLDFSQDFSASLTCIRSCVAFGF